MALDFPNSPTLNQIFESGDGRSWIWNGTTWDAVLTVAPAGPAGADGATGADGADGATGADGADGAPGVDGEANFNSFLLLGA